MAANGCNATSSRTYTVEESSAVLDKVSGDYEMEGVRVAVVTEDRYEEVLELIGDSFVTDEPLNNAFGLARSPEWDDIIRDLLRQNLSAMAIHKETGDIMAVSISLVSRQDDTSSNTHVEATNDDTSSSMQIPSQLNDIFSLLMANEQKSDLFNRYGVTEMLQHFMVVVNRKYRNKGVATQLAALALAVTKEYGFKAVSGQATSKYSQNICKRIGFEIVFEVPYDSVRIRGQPLVLQSNEHKTIQVVAMKLE